MKLFRSMVGFISGRMVAHLIRDGVIEVEDRSAVVAAVSSAFTGDLQVEDRLNEEVREIMIKYADEMNRTGVQYHEMFKKIKGQLVRQRSLIL